MRQITNLSTLQALLVLPEEQNPRDREKDENQTEGQEAKREAGERTKEALHG
jgi:hypothetical protein